MKPGTMPWFRQRLMSIRWRCRKSRGYATKGIKCRLTTEELRLTYFRDNADKINRPHVDRINPDGDYAWNNVRWIEGSLNATRTSWGYSPEKPVTLWLSPWYLKRLVKHAKNDYNDALSMAAKRLLMKGLLAAPRLKNA